jgi:hypothetical protein
MLIDSRSAQQQGSAAAKKERRALDAAQALRDYEATRVAIRAKTERLRAARSAKEAGDSAPKKMKRRLRTGNIAVPASNA